MVPAGTRGLGVVCSLRYRWIWRIRKRKRSRRSSRCIGTYSNIILIYFIRHLYVSIYTADKYIQSTQIWQDVGLTFENCRLNKENDIADMKKKETRLQIENKRLRAELLVLQKTCTNLRAERDKAIDAEQAAQVRAAAFQSDRDKVQRNFKVSD